MDFSSVKSDQTVGEGDWIGVLRNRRVEVGRWRGYDRGIGDEPQEPDAMEFPRIETIADVEPDISFDQGFVVSRRGSHSVIDYVYVADDTFDSAIRLECRGLKFDRNGKLIGRPFHKFFNLGERQALEEIDWTSPHRVLSKLDGSMVHPVLLDGELVYMTRMGATPQAEQARRHMASGVLDLSRFLLEGGVTPIFEFTAPDNRIVVAYDYPQVTLLAARELQSGSYLSHDDLVALGQRFEVAVVADMGAIEDAKAFVARARTEEGIEGYVLAFEDGHRLKLKTDGYALRHRALAGIHLEKNVLAWVVNNAVDDVVVLLSPELGQRVRQYEAGVQARVSMYAQNIAAFVSDHRDLPRKDFAALAFKTFDKRLAAVAFTALDGGSARQALMGILQHASQTETRIGAVRDLFGLNWSVEGLQLPGIEI
jgi:RNA ligase